MCEGMPGNDFERGCVSRLLKRKGGQATRRQGSEGQRNRAVARGLVRRTAWRSHREGHCQRSRARTRRALCPPPPPACVSPTRGPPLPPPVFRVCPSAFALRSPTPLASPLPSCCPFLPSWPPLAFLPPAAVLASMAPSRRAPRNRARARGRWASASKEQFQDTSLLEHRAVAPWGGGRPLPAIFGPPNSAGADGPLRTSGALAALERQRPSCG